MNATVKKGILFGRNNGCELYLEIKVGKYVWNMYSVNTGHHAIEQKIEPGTKEPKMNERAQAHWDGFQKNQSR